MLVKVVCPNPECGASFAVPGEVIGRKGKCKRCGRSFAMEGAGEVSTSASLRVEGTQVNAYSVVPGGSEGGDLSFVAGPKSPSRRSIPAQFGRYRILRPIGQGGMGSVFLARDTQLDREVALKVPHVAPEDGAAGLDRFYREAKAAAMFDHPNLCPIYDVGEFEGIPYLTMPYLSGRPLSERIDPASPLPSREAATIVRKLALALAQAHGRGLIHRDLKPANVMVVDGRDLVIMDFGLARREQSAAESRLTNSGAILGTPAYMAPEQVRGDLAAMGPRTDVYSLGVILYELLTGHLPFEGPPGLVMGLIAVMAAPAPSTHRPDLDPALEAICLKAMAKDVDERFASMDDFAWALDEFLESGSVASEPPSFAAVTSGIASADPVVEIEPTATVTLRPARRPRRRVLPFAVAAAVVLTLGAIAWLRPGREPTSAAPPSVATPDPPAIVAKAPEEKREPAKPPQPVAETPAATTPSGGAASPKPTDLASMPKEESPPPAVPSPAPSPPVPAPAVKQEVAAAEPITSPNNEDIKAAIPDPPREPDPIRDKLEEAQQAYQDELERMKNELVASWQKKEDRARKDGNVREVEKLKAELAALQEKGELPKPIPRAYQTDMSRARNKMIDVFTAAEKAYLKERQDERMKEVRKQHEAFVRDGQATRAVVRDALQAGTHWSGWREQNGKQKDFEMEIVTRQGPGFSGTVTIEGKRVYRIVGQIRNGMVGMQTERVGVFFQVLKGQLRGHILDLEYGGPGIDGKLVSGRARLALDQP